MKRGMPGPALVAALDPGDRARLAEADVLALGAGEALTGSTGAGLGDVQRAAVRPSAGLGEGELARVVEPRGNHLRPVGGLAVCQRGACRPDAAPCVAGRQRT